MISELLNRKKVCLVKISVVNLTSSLAQNSPVVFQRKHNALLIE